MAAINVITAEAAAETARQYYAYYRPKVTELINLILSEIREASSNGIDYLNITPTSIKWGGTHELRCVEELSTYLDSTSKDIKWKSAMHFSHLRSFFRLYGYEVEKMAGANGDFVLIRWGHSKPSLSPSFFH